MSRDTAPDEVQGLRIYLLGGFRVMVGQRTIGEAEWRLRKAKSLVKMLALVSNHSYHREQVLEQLWPDLEPEAALNNLHRVIHVARHVLEPHLGPSQRPAYLRFQDDILKLSPSLPLWIDVEQFEAARNAIRHAQEPAPYLAAIELYSGDLLPEDRYEDWAIRRRERARQSYLTLLDDVAQIYITRKEYDAAIETLQKLVAEEPVLEEAHLRLSRLYARTGQRYQALRQYQQLRDALKRELDAEPATEIQRLYQDIRSSHLAPQEEQLPVRSQEGNQTTPPTPSVEERTDQSANRHTNLPHALTSFIGREQEITEIGHLLKRARLVTLTGSGGSGKTRLAIQTAASLSEQFAGGAWLVELAALTDPSFVPQAVATTLNVRETSDRPLMEQLVEALRSKRMLLLLDNCEHLVDACAHLADALLQACPNLHILATSRQALGLIGEITWRVPALPVPDPDRLPPFEHLLRYDAVRLFYERASSSRPDFTLTPQNGAAVVQICRRLDGIPLAIELAAVRVKALSADQLAARLDDALSLLVTGSRTAQQRQRTLRATCDWSYALLNEEEQALFRRLSIFAGGWTLEAAEQIDADLQSPSSLSAGVGGGSAVIFDLLAQLVDKSLVVMVERGDHTRYRMLEALRQYGAEKLAAAHETALLRERHAAWYLALVEKLKPQWEGAGQAALGARLDEEHDNMRAALQWALEKSVGDTGLRLGGALWRFWQVRGYLTEGRVWLEKLLEKSSDTSAAPRAVALQGAGVLAMDQGDYGRAKELYEESLALYRAEDNSDGIMTTLNNLGIVVEASGDYMRAAELYEESLALARQQGNQSVLARALNNLGVTVYRQGDYERASALYEESLALVRASGNEANMVVALNNVAEVACRKGDYAQAGVRYREGLPLAQSLGYRTAIAFYLGGLAEVASGLGQAQRAARLWGAEETLREAVGAPLEPDDQPRYHRLVTAARAQLDENEFARLWAEGRTVLLEQTVAYAMEDEPPAQPAPRLDETTPQRNALSPREWQIAQLIAAGLTNREIAGELAIAQRTVDTHISNILTRLGFTSRAQVMEWVRTDAVKSM